MEYAHSLILLYFFVVILAFFLDTRIIFIHIIGGSFTATEATCCQGSNQTGQIRQFTAHPMCRAVIFFCKLEHGSKLHNMTESESALHT